MTIGGRPKTTKPDSNPGPGQYEQKSNFNQTKSQKANIGKAPRSVMKSQDYSNVGPGAYDAKDFLTKARNPTTFIGGTSQRLTSF